MIQNDIGGQARFHHAPPMGYALIKRPNSVALIGGGTGEGGTKWDVQHRMLPDDVLGGRKVSEWPKGVSKVADADAQKFMEQVNE